MDELEMTIYDNLADELYERGYGVERLGSVNENSEWFMLILVAVALYLVWK